MAIPLQPGWAIARPRLADRLTRGTRGALTVVTGAPGSGKTMVVSAWAGAQRSQGSAVAWLTCEPNATEEKFWRAMWQAMEAAGVHSARRSAEEEPGGPAALAAALAERTDPVVLVLDDFRAEPGSAVADGVGRLLEHAESGLRTVVVARHDPALPLHRYRLARELTEIRAEALAFSERETRELLAQHEVELPARLIARLRDRTEGWAAGLRLAAMSIAAQPEPAPSVEEFAGDDRAVVGYLTEEVLALQPEEVRRALLASSVTERFNAELVAELAGRPADGLFAEMVGRNAFLLPLGDGWYRHHRLFREAIRAILDQERPDDIADLHRTAANWFIRRGLLADAVQHAGEAGDRRLACRLIVDRVAVGKVIGLDADGGLGAGLRLSDEEILMAGSEPEPALVEAALALSAGDDRACARALGRGLSILQELPADQALPARLTAVIVQLARVLWSRPGDPSIARLATEADDLLNKVRLSTGAEYKDLRALVGLTHGTLALWAGRLPDAATALNAVVRQSATLGESLRRTALAHLALVEALLGRFALASDFSTKAAQLPEVCPSPGGRIAAAHVASAWIHLQAYELTAANRELDKARLGLRDGDAGTAALYGLVRAQTEFALRRLDQGLERINEAEEAASGLPWLRRRIALTGAALNLSRGNGRLAFQAVERAGRLESADALVVLARIHLWRGDRTTAVRTLRPALAEGGAMPVDVRVEAWLLDSLLAIKAGDASRARRSLDRALRLGERGRIRLPFALAGEWLAPVLRRDPELFLGHRFLLEPLGLRPLPAGRGQQPRAGMSEPHGRLSTRELEVLRYVAQMMTTEEIAEEMYLSTNTIKTHLKSIYRKLAVTRRAEAVRRARRLALL